MNQRYEIVSELSLIFLELSVKLYLSLSKIIEMKSVFQQKKIQTLRIVAVYWTKETLVTFNTFWFYVKHRTDMQNT